MCLLVERMHFQDVRRRQQRQQRRHMTHGPARSHAARVQHRCRHVKIQMDEDLCAPHFCFFELQGTATILKNNYLSVQFLGKCVFRGDRHSVTASVSPARRCRRCEGDAKWSIARRRTVRIELLDLCVLPVAADFGWAFCTNRPPSHLLGLFVFV